MARIRTIKPEFWTSEQIADCSPTARLLFIGLWNFCDDAGRHPASAKRLKMEVFPSDAIETTEVAKWIDELINAGLVVSYVVGQQWFWQVTGWHHQKIEKPTLKYPEPIDSATARRPLADSSPPEGKGREGMYKKENIKRKKPTLEEITAYCLERNDDIDPQSFLDYYDANGWVQGKGRKPIVDWKAAIRTWEKNRRAERRCQVPTAEELARYNPVTGID